MKNVINVVILLLLISGTAWSQTTPKSDAPPEAVSTPKEPMTYVEQMPTFPGGQEALQNYLATTLKYPKDAQEKGIEGKVFISFVVEADGKVTRAKIIRGLGGTCDAEALRVVQAMPSWTPGRQNGKPVAVQFNLPINFKLANPDPLMKGRKKN